MSQSPGQELLNNGRNYTPTIHHKPYEFISPNRIGNKYQGKTVLVTGASRGIGKGVALAFARAGATNIAIGARSSCEALVPELKAAAAECNHPPPKILALQMDISSQPIVEVAVESVEKAFGRLDVLVNNAAFTGKWGPLHETDPADWLREITTNIYGTYLVTRCFLPLIMTDRHTDSMKTIITTSSAGAHECMNGPSAYILSKLSLLRLSETLMDGYGKEGLLAYSFHPGEVLTEMGMAAPEFIKDHLIDSEDLCGATMAWLASERREWLAGRYIASNWDMEELLGKEDDIVAKDLLKVRMAVC